jgi:hypothetical protein
VLLLSTPAGFSLERANNAFVPTPSTRPDETLASAAAAGTIGLPEPRRSQLVLQRQIHHANSPLFTKAHSHVLARSTIQHVTTSSRVRSRGPPPISPPLTRVGASLLAGSPAARLDEVLSSRVVDTHTNHHHHHHHHGFIQGRQSIQGSFLLPTIDLPLRNRKFLRRAPCPAVYHVMPSLRDNTRTPSRSVLPILLIGSIVGKA